MNKDKLKNELTEIVAYKFDQLEHLFEGKYPPFENHGLEKYKGIEAPYPYVVLNNFKHQVDDFVSIIMLVIDQSNVDENLRKLADEAERLANEQG